MGLIEDAIYNAPQSILSISDTNIINTIGKYYLPYSIGLEFECNKKETYNIECFDNIPNILDVNVDNYEQRYRIPTGINGLICLHNICTQLKINTILNTESSIHIHTDMTDVWNDLNINSTTEKHDYSWIIEELKTWGTAVDYRQIDGWYRWNSLQTLEIRICEPTFDYPVLVNRVIQCCNIARKVKELAYNPVFRLETLNNQLNLLNITSLETPAKEENILQLKNVLKTRITKL